MVKRFLIIFLVVSLSFSGLYASDSEPLPTTEEVSQALTVIMDCLSASLVTSCTNSSIKLPNSTVSISQTSNLPLRIAYFLADPSEYCKALTPATEGSGLLSTFLAFLNNTIQDPLLSTVYVVMSSRDYENGDYLISGSINFTYPEGATLNDVIAVWATRVNTDQSIGMNVDIGVYGEKMERPLTLAGNFVMSVNEEGQVEVSSVGEYTINGYRYQGGQFTF
jgi:hypothetical protein